MLSQKLTRLWIDETNLQSSPLNVNPSADPARRRSIVGFYFDRTVQMNRAYAVLITAERLQGQREQGRFFFSKHSGHFGVWSCRECVYPLIAFRPRLKPSSIISRFGSQALTG